MKKQQSIRAKPQTPNQMAFGSPYDYGQSIQALIIVESAVELIQKATFNEIRDRCIK
jgi:hypothetical protein